MLIGNGTWVLVADGEKFLLLSNHGDEDIIDLRVVRHGEVENPPTHVQRTDRPGAAGRPRRTGPERGGGDRLAPSGKGALRQRLGRAAAALGARASW